jgi:hypothetical protein
MTAEELEFGPFRTQRFLLHDILGHQRLRNGRIQIASKDSLFQDCLARIVQSSLVLDLKATLNERFDGQQCLLESLGSPEPRSLKQKAE